MTRVVARGLAAGVALTLACAAVAAATTYRGAAVDDAQMPVKVKVGAEGALQFTYSHVLVACTSGDRVRQGGADHSTALSEAARFKDTIEQEAEGAVATSFVRGRVGEHRARGTLRYDLSYADGSCHSGEIEWRAKRR